MVNMKTDTSKKISLYGILKLKDEKNIKNIGIEYENICNVIESFYTTLNKANIKLIDVKQINLYKMIMNNKCIDCNNKGFWIAGYAKKKILIRKV